jgi:hypothetical protein
MFMKPEVYFGLYFAVETSQGTEIVPEGIAALPLGVNFKAGNSFDSDSQFWDLIQKAFIPCIDGQEIESVDCQEGWIARMSAPGYMDCTVYSAHDSECEAWEHLIDMYCDGELAYEWLPASWGVGLIDKRVIRDKQTSDSLANWLAENYETLDIDSAYTVGESRVISDAAWGAQDCRMFIFKVKQS